jgi:probable lipoprotein NlpC
MKRTFLSLLLLLLLFLLAGGGLLVAVPPIRTGGLQGAGALRARLKLLAAAEAYLGTPYTYGGVSRSGLDCSGLVYLSFRDALAAGVPRTTETLFTWVERISDDELRVGDLVFFVTGGAGVSHAGIYAGDGRFIHSASEGPETGVMYSRLDERYWKRTYTGAGRALPWDGEAEAALAETGLAEAASRPGGGAGGIGDAVQPAGGGAGETDEPATEKARRRWTQETGFFTGAGLSVTYGGFIKGAPSMFRGLAAQGKIGYKGLFSDSVQIALEIRPGFDCALGVGRVPFTVSLGTDTFQVFAGPGLTIGSPSLDVDGGRDYHPAFSFLAEAGFQTALPPIEIAGGALSVFAELAWQPFARNDGVGADWQADLTANVRLSVGLRYLWFFGGL